MIVIAEIPEILVGVTVAENKRLFWFNWCYDWFFL